MRKPKSAKPRQQSTAAAEPSAAVWFKLYPAKWAGLAMREPDNSKLGERVRRIVLALCEQEPGADAFADEVMQTTADAMQRYSEAGRKAARARWADKTPCDRNAIGMRSDNIRQEGDKKETRKEGDKSERETADAEALTQSQIEIPSLEVFRSFGAKHGMDPVKVEKCFRHYEASGWRDAQGQPVRNWKAKLSSWMNRPELEATGAKRAEVKPAASGKEFSSSLNPRIIRN